VGLWWGRAEAGAPSAADVGFLRDMVAHHDQGVGMSLAVLDSPLPPPVRPYAQEIVVTQRYEMGLMEGTLLGWGEDTEGDGTAMAWMGHPTPTSAMPGLATEQEMDDLARATGDDAGARWIALMTRHHVAGAEMAEAAAERAEDDLVRRIAGLMARNQRLEIEEYEAVRARLGLPVVPLGPGAAGEHVGH
jgi:uncharacterized protein (DUF305 family)